MLALAGDAAAPLTRRPTLSMDMWRAVFEFVDSDQQVLRYRLVNKQFSQLALETISSLRLGYSMADTVKLTRKMSILLARPFALRSLDIVLRHTFQDFAAFYRLVSSCKELRRLSITVFCASSLDRDSPMLSSSPSSFGSPGNSVLLAHGNPLSPPQGYTTGGLNGAGLCAIGANCAKLEDFSLHISRSFTMQDGVTDFLSAFPHIKSLCVRPVESRGNVDVSPARSPALMANACATPLRAPAPALSTLRRLEKLDGSLLSQVCLLCADSFTPPPRCVHPREALFFTPTHSMPLSFPTWQHPWRVAVSQLTTLKDLTWRCRVSDVHVQSFTQLCRGQPIASTLEKVRACICVHVSPPWPAPLLPW